MKCNRHMTRGSFIKITRIKSINIEAKLSDILCFASFCNEQLRVQQLFAVKNYLSEHKPMCSIGTVKAAHFTCLQSEREMYSDTDCSLAGFPPSATSWFDSHDTGGKSFPPKKTVKICLLPFCHYLVFSQ